MPYYDELKGGVILSIGNIKAKDIETVSKLLSNKGPNDRVRVQMITKNGELVRFIM